MTKKCGMVYTIMYLMTRETTVAEHENTIAPEERASTEPISVRRGQSSHRSTISASCVITATSFRKGYN